MAVPLAVAFEVMVPHEATPHVTLQVTPVFDGKFATVAVI